MKKLIAYFEDGKFRDHVDDAAGKTGDILRSRYGIWALGIISFVESALVIPIITDPFLVVYILADKARALRAVIMTTLSSVLGGVFAYVLAVAFFEFVAVQYLSGPLAVEFYEIAGAFQDNTFIFTLLGALTPIPYTLVALAIGFVEGSLIAFILASLLGRGLRYVVVGWVTYHVGDHALEIARKRMALITVLVVIAVTAYVIWHILYN